jgi:hypothetical protein
LLLSLASRYSQQELWLFEETGIKLEVDQFAFLGVT